MTDDMDARARVKRLEAALRECEARMEARDRGIDELRERNKQLRRVAGLDPEDATPPPEGEPTLMETARREGKLAGNAELAEFWGNAPHTPEQPAQYGEITESESDMGLPGMWQAADFVGAPDDTPQAHGDALAAFARLCNWYDVPGDNDDVRVPDASEKDVETVREALTASGVPYVPESVRDLPEKIAAKRLTYPQDEVAEAYNDGLHVAEVAVKKAFVSAPAVCIDKRVDYEELLRKYLAYLVEVEGSTLMHRRSSTDEIQFTEEEWAELERIAAAWR